MGRYIDPNSGRAPQPGGRSRANRQTPTTASIPHPDSVAVASNRARREVKERQAQLQAKRAEQEAEEVEPEAEEAEVEEAEAEEAEASDHLDELYRDDLVEIATNREIVGRHQMTRQELIEAIRAD